MSQMETVNGAEALLELFRTQGADYIFCSPIAAWAPLWEALAKRKATTNIEMSENTLTAVTRFSRSRLAAGYYKATGRTQAVLLPTGLGVLHGALGDAFGISRTHPYGDRLTGHAVPRRNAGPRSRPRMADAPG